jgi:hydroxyacylglutathione hydrolase
MEVCENIIYIEGVGFNSNIYIIGKNEIGIIDTGASATCIDSILKAMQKFGLERGNVKKLILTHIHPDHTGGIPEFIDAFDPLIYMHKAEAPRLFRNPPPKLHLLEGGETLTIDTLTLQVIHTPGHSAGCCCFYEGKWKVLFSGDTVFSFGNIGRTDLGGDPELLVNSIEKLLKLDVEYICPGHMVCTKGGNKSIQQSYNFAKMVL